MLDCTRIKKKVKGAYYATGMPYREGNQKPLRKARESTAQEQSIYRCFLPNLAGFESCPLHSPGHF